MNARALAIVSLLINASLLAVVLSGHRAVPVKSPAGAEPTMAGTGAVVTASPSHLRTGASQETADDSYPEAAAAFHWSQVASTDFVAYRDRLRALGCPDRTVRDILTAEINQHFETRRMEVVTRLQAQFWEVLARRGGHLDDLFEEDLEPLKAERNEALKAVLDELPGDDQAEARKRQFAEWQREYHWLPAEKQGQLAVIEAKASEGFEALEREIRELPPHEQQAERLRRRAALEAELAAERQAALTAEEWAEFDLRQSRTKDWASGADGFAATEAEWRAVTKALKEFAPTTADGASGPRSKAAQRALAEARQREREQLIESTLGPERYAEYQRSSDGDFQQLRRVTDRLDLDDSKAIAAYELRQALSDEMRQLGQQTFLSAEELREAEQAIRARARETLSITLGTQGMEVYLENGGDWLQDPSGE
jgi:hypothetical protein